jgi:hypothetical protein
LRPPAPRTDDGAVSQRLQIAPPASRSRWAGSRDAPSRTEILALAALLVLVLAVISLHVHAYQRLSPIDELHHVDYLIKSADGQLLRRGDVIGPETRKEGACRGVDAPGYSADCNDEGWLAGREFNTEEIQPPAYYFLTAWTARLLRPFLGTSSLVAAGRMVGALWLGAGVVAVWVALRMLGASILVRWAVGALLVTTPVVLHASTTVTNDATSLVAGAAMLLAVLAWERHRAPAWLVILATVVGVSLRLTNFVGAGMVILYLVLRALQRDDDAEASPGRSSRSHLGMAAAVASAVVVTGLAWVSLNSAVARVGPLANPNTFNQQAESISLDTVLSNSGAAVPPTRDPYLVPFLQNEKFRTMVRATDWLLVGAAIGLAALASRRSSGEALGAAAIVCAVATGPVLTVSNFIFQHAYYPIPPRYGLSVIPAFAVGLGLTAQKSWTRVAVAGFAGVSVVLTLVALVGAG